jgi:predicted transposase/invertase (TIGR01784 family)
MASKGKSKTGTRPKAVKANASKETLDDAGVYINILTDFGFKRIFGTEENKDLLIDFLNVALNLEDGIKELYYTNPERKKKKKNDPKVVFDLHCITKNDERIIIEMQRVSQTYYKDRALYYASFPIQEQGKRARDWDYKLQPVYSVNIVNFILDENRETPKYTSYIQLTDRDTYEVFYDKLMFVYLELPRFTKSEDELETNVERWMFVLKNLSSLNDLPDTLRNEVFQKLFEQAKIANMTKEELEEYQESLKNYRDMYLIENEYKRNLAATIAEKDRYFAAMQKKMQKNLIVKDKALVAERNALVAERKAHQKALFEVSKKDAELAELKRRFGLS